jgi:cellulose biosynthesis protein BcsQ
MFARFCVCSQTLQRIGEQTRNHENSRHHQPKRRRRQDDRRDSPGRSRRTTRLAYRRVRPRPTGLCHQLVRPTDLVLIDSAPNADAASLAAARVADLILIPCRPAAFDLDAIGTTLNLATLAGKPAWVVLNAVSPHGKLGEEAAVALRQGGVQVAPLTVHHLVAFAHAVNDGRTAQEYDPKSRAATEVDTLFRWLTKILDLQTSKRVNVQTRKRANIQTRKRA